jgi:hypothetical protein
MRISKKFKSLVLVGALLMALNPHGVLQYLPLFSS